MAISETKWLPNPSFLGLNFPFFQFFYFQFKFKLKFKFNTFFLTDILTENEKIRMSTFEYKRLKRTID